MDYEKKYKEALALAHSYYDKDSMNAFLDTIFPELKENEDEKIRKALVWHLKADVDFVSNGVTKAECLAYLDKQKAQKQEWGEEDEKMLENIRYALGYAFVNNVIDEQTTDYVTTWLKSLRPRSSWKPSEEQIYSLGTVVKGAGENSVGSVAYNLKELYEELKKL